MSRSTVSIIIPAYNEEETIGKVIAETISIMNSLGLPYEIIVVDDGSTDRTAQVASQHKVNVLFNGRNRGKGYSIRRALKHARGDIIITLDSDGEHQPKEIPDLLEPLFNGADIVTGSRFMQRKKKPTTALNRIGNYFFNTAILSLTGKHVTDSQTGFRAMKKSVIDKLELEAEGYEIETEITVKALRNGFTLHETPISCEKRKHNGSKIRIASDGAKILRTIIRARFKP